VNEDEATKDIKEALEDFYEAITNLVEAAEVHAKDLMKEIKEKAAQIKNQDT